MQVEAAHMTKEDKYKILEVLDTCLEFMEDSHVEDIILNKINDAIKILEES